MPADAADNIIILTILQIRNKNNQVYLDSIYGQGINSTNFQVSITQKFL